MKKLQENRVLNKTIRSLTKNNIIDVFSEYGWNLVKDYLGRDDDFSFVRGSDRISVNTGLHGYDLIVFKDFSKNEYSSDYARYVGSSLKGLIADLKDIDQLQDTDFEKYQTPRLFYEDTQS